MAQRRAPDCLVPAPPAAKNKNLFPSPPPFFFFGAGERAQPGARFWLPSPLRQLTAGLDESERKEKERGKPALFGGSGLRARCGRPGKQTRCSLVPHPLHPRVPGVFKPPGQRGFAVPGIDPDPVAERPWRGGELRRGERRAGPAGNGARPKLLLWIRHKRDPKRPRQPPLLGVLTQVRQCQQLLLGQRTGITRAQAFRCHRGEEETPLLGGKGVLLR